MGTEDPAAAAVTLTGQNVQHLLDIGTHVDELPGNVEQHELCNVAGQHSQLLGLKCLETALVIHASAGRELSRVNFREGAAAVQVPLGGKISRKIWPLSQGCICM